MNMRRIPGSLLLMATSVAALSACSPDYSGVRTWATTASLVVATTDTASASATTAALRETAIAHLGALSRLAMDGLLRHETGPLATQAATLGGAETEAGRAAHTISALQLRASEELWRAPQLRQMIVSGDAAFREIVAQLLATERAEEEAEARHLAQRQTALTQSLLRVRDPAARNLLTEAALFHDNAAEQRNAARRLRRDALTRIAAMHSTFAQDPHSISRAEVVRSAYEAEAALRRALTTAMP